MKRGQAALEFLMTYGWAILVVIIVIGALAAFGVFDVSRLIPDRCVISPSLSCQDHGVVNGSVMMVLVNGLGQDIEITKVTARDRDTDEDVCELKFPTGVTSQEIGNQDRATVALDCGTKLKAKSGKYRLDVTLVYNYLNSNIPKTIQGDVTVSVSEENEAITTPAAA
ncbi:hypothetical protein KY330_02820 [Candidatus Woesearchaeota archaeon]|nr:hypothetical protein [Candidatus Woesearchaeota archaeon]